jgi:predicted DNA-binding protein
MTKPITRQKRYSVKLTNREEILLEELVSKIGVTKSEIIRNAIEFMYYNHPTMEVKKLFEKQENQTEIAK